MDRLLRLVVVPLAETGIFRSPPSSSFTSGSTNSVRAVGQTIAVERDRVLPPSGTKGVSAQPRRQCTVQLGLGPIRFVPIS